MCLRPAGRWPQGRRPRGVRRHDIGRDREHPHGDQGRSGRTIHLNHLQQQARTTPSSLNTAPCDRRLLLGLLARVSFALSASRLEPNSPKTLTLQASRDYMRASRGVRHPEMILAKSAHAAYWKVGSGSLFDVDRAKRGVGMCPNSQGSGSVCLIPVTPAVLLLKFLSDLFSSPVSGF